MEYEQLSMFGEPEDERTRVVEKLLLFGGCHEGSKRRTLEKARTVKSETELANWLKDEYGTGGHCPVFFDSHTYGYFDSLSYDYRGIVYKVDWKEKYTIPFSEAASVIMKLIANGRWEKELENDPD